MRKIFGKLIFSLSIIIAPFILNSCLNTNEEPGRTEADEQEELNNAIANVIKNGYDVDTTNLGSYYIVNKTGTGDFPQSGDTVKLIYTGFFLDGSVFDSSINQNNPDSLYELIFLKTPLITGFNEAISMMNKGADIDFIMPSKLAYGSTGIYEIKPYTPLGFNIKMRYIGKVR